MSLACLKHSRGTLFPLKEKLEIKNVSYHYRANGRSKKLKPHSCNDEESAYHKLMSQVKEISQILEKGSNNSKSDNRFRQIQKDGKIDTRVSAKEFSYKIIKELAAQTDYGSERLNLEEVTVSKKERSTESLKNWKRNIQMKKEILAQRISELRNKGTSMKQLDENIEFRYKKRKNLALRVQALIEESSVNNFFSFQELEKPSIIPIHQSQQTQQVSFNRIKRLHIYAHNKMHSAAKCIDWNQDILKDIEKNPKNSENSTDYCSIPSSTRVRDVDKEKKVCCSSIQSSYDNVMMEPNNLKPSIFKTLRRLSEKCGGAPGSFGPLNIMKTVESDCSQTEKDENLKQDIVASPNIGIFKFEQKNMRKSRRIMKQAEDTLATSVQEKLPMELDWSENQTRNSDEKPSLQFECEIGDCLEKKLSIEQEKLLASNIQNEKSAKMTSRQKRNSDYFRANLLNNKKYFKEYKSASSLNFSKFRSYITEKNTVNLTRIRNLNPKNDCSKAEKRLQDAIQNQNWVMEIKSPNIDRYLKRYGYQKRLTE